MQTPGRGDDHPPPPVAAKRLATIEMLRGLAALLVVIHHAVAAAIPRAGAEHRIDQITQLGSFSVWLFFVISGFCIHLRWAKSSDGGIPEFIPFWRRRLTRLYPTYLSVLVIAVLVLPQHPFGGAHASYAYDISLHLVMLHNLDGRTIYSFIAPFWTLALEEQLYLAYFPLLWLRRRFGWGTTLAICACARLVTYAAGSLLYGHGAHNVPIQPLVTSQWFIWALGALSAEAYFGKVQLPRWCSQKASALGLIVSIGIVAIWTQSHPNWRWIGVYRLLLDPLLGLACFCLLNYLLTTEGRKLGWLAGPAAVMTTIGTFSYSLYLTHPLWTDNWLPMLFRGAGARPSVLLMLCALPVPVLFAWAYFYVLERPFISLAQRVPATKG